MSSVLKVWVDFLEFKSFMAGILFTLGLQAIFPFLGVKIDVVLPYAPLSTIATGITFLLIAYYLFKSN
ncbi:MAG: hypothetical protein QXN37_04435 [Candidatus Anstonellaceae archaeon]